MRDMFFRDAMKLMRYLSALALLAAATTPTMGQSDAEKNPPAATGEQADSWQVKTFRVPEGFVWQTVESIPEDPLQGAPQRKWQPPKTIPALPPIDAPESAWVSHLKESTAIVREAMDSWGITLPFGTIVLHDPKSGTVAVRTTTVNMEIVGSQFWSALRRVPQTPVFQLEVVQSDAETILNMAQACATGGDHSEECRAMRQLVQKGEAKSVGSLRLETRSGQRTLSEAARECLQASGATIDSSGRVELLRESRPVGIRLELDPILNREGHMVDVNFAFEFHYAPPTQRAEFAGHVGRLARIECPMTDYHTARVTSAISIFGGTSRLLGIWKPEGAPEFATGGIMQAAFLTADVIRLLPAENKDLATTLLRYADKAEAVPTPPNSPVRKLGESMRLQRFDVPTDFLAAAAPGGAAAPPDPFAPAGKNPPAWRPTLSAMDVLKANGVGFPEGSLAVFDAATNQLIVTNTQDNLDQIDAFVSPFGCGRGPSGVAATLHIVEADGPSLRMLLQEHGAQADQTALWRDVEALVSAGTAKRLGAARLETSSGQRATFEAGEERMSAGGLKFGKLTTEADSAEPKVAESSASDPDRTAASKATPPQPSDAHFMSISHEMHRAGTRLEIDPVIGPDGLTIDLNLSLEHHYAPPTVRPVPPAANGETLVVAMPATDFHMAKVTTAITLTSGMTKLIGVWTPEGAPKYEGKDVMQAAFLRVDRVAIEKK